MPAQTVLVVGAGSAGRRHARNLIAEGARVSCVDPRADRLTQARAELPRLDAFYPSLAEALDARWDGVVIATPPSLHVEQALPFVDRGVPVLLEKPLAPNLASALRLEAAVRRSGVPVLLGYTYRWWPPFLDLRRRLAERQVGVVRHVRIVMSAHLADWHPWERYQDFFMASAALGGGALLDESHFIDLLLWLFGIPQAVMGRVERISSLEITSDDTVDVLCLFPGNLRATVHLDLFGRPHEKSVRVVGEGGTLEVGFDPHVVRVAHAAEPAWEAAAFACERNDMFLAEAREFLGIVGGSETPTCTVEDGVRVLRCVEAVRESTATGRLVELARG